MKKAFTLAEVLITLTIIGVVATLTVPNLVNKYQKKQLENEIKLTYSLIQQTMEFSKLENNEYEGFTDGNDKMIKTWYDTYIQPRMKIQKYCINKAGCWHKKGTAKDLQRQLSPWDSDKGIGNNILTFITEKGQYFNMDGYTISDCQNRFGINSGGSCLIIYFDANGARKPNRIGKDIQIVAWTEKGLLPAGRDKTEAEVNNNCLNGNGYWCLQKLFTDNWEIPNEIWKK